MAVPSMSTFYAGQRLRAADMNSQVRDAVNWTISGKTCRAVRTGSQSISANTWTAINLDNEDFDPYSWHDGVGAFPSIVLPSFPGYYHVSASVAFVADASGVREAAIRCRSHNAGPFVFAGATAPGYTGGTNPSTKLSVSTTVYMNGSTDYAELIVWHNSSTNPLNTTVTGSACYSSLSVTFIGT